MIVFNETVNGNKLSMAFMLRDSFHDKILKEKDFKFYINNKLKEVIAKYDGYYVISGLQENEFDLKISSSDYYEKTLHVNLNKIKNIDKFEEISLIPHYKYKNQPSNYYLEGIAVPETYVFATKLSNRTNVRYKSFDADNSLLNVLNPTRESLSGHLLSICDVTNNKFQPFFVKYKLADDCYKINCYYSMNTNYKSLLPIQKAYIAKTNSKGYYRLYVAHHCLQDEKYIISYFKDEENIFKVVDVNIN